MTPDSLPAPPPLVLDVLAERFGFLFAKLHQRWIHESVNVLHGAGLGLSALHFGAISVIDSAGPMSQQALGEHIQKDRTTIVAIVDELEAEGLVERRRNPVDRRAYALEVTDQGREWIAEAGPLLDDTDSRLLNELDPAERELLVGLLRRVLLSTPPPAQQGR